MITEEDMAVARRMASKYRGPRFNKDDAFQAAIEQLIRKNPKDRGLRVLAMRNGIARAFTECNYQMSVPRASFDRMKKEGRLPDHLGDLIVDDLVFEIPHEQREYELIEDEVSAHNVMARLGSEHQRVVQDFMRGRRPGYTTRARDKALLEEALIEMRGMME